MDAKSSRLGALLAELRRRRVFRVAVFYAVAAYGVLQAADVTFPLLRFPDWGVTVVLAVALLGFPVAMVLAWAFDITARGVVRTAPAADAVGRPRKSSSAAALAAVVVVSSLAVAAGWYVLPKLPGWWGVGARVAEASGPRKLLVVLPFVNLGSPVDEYFADGITEEITARLAVISGLGVIARTTAVQYRDTDKTVREIGEDLGVDYVLEGTVRWQKDPAGPSRVRVTPQLIRVNDATHVWAEIYEEPMESVFEVQSEIAERVVDALDLRLAGPERRALKAEPTQNLEAYSYYLLADRYLQSSTLRGSGQEALELLEKAVELDPKFDLARGKLAEVLASLYWANFRMLFGVRSEDYGAVLDPLYPGSFGADTAAYHLATAILSERAQQPGAARSHFDSAAARLEPQVADKPGDARLHGQLGLAYAGLGRRREAVAEGRRAVQLLPAGEDPYVGGALADNLAHIYVLVGEHEAAIDELERLLSLETPISVAWLRVDPTWDPLRDYPRFRALVEDE